MRKAVSFSCLLLAGSLWAASAQAQASNTTVPPSPTIDWKVDLKGTTVPVGETDAAAGVRAIRAYDESMRNWSLPAPKLDEIRRDFSVRDPQKFDPLYSEPAPKSQRDLEWGRQRFADQVADAIYPGFGRVETTYENGASSRLDYLVVRRCGVRGIGVCYQYRF